MTPAARTTANLEPMTSAAELAARAASGDRDALAALVHAHHADMVRVSFVVCGELDLAEDAAQSAWLRAATRLGSLRDHTRVRAWLCTLAANEARMALRRRRPTMPLDALPSQTTDGRSATIDLIDLAESLRRLDVADRQLLALRYIGGFTSPELADGLGITPAGVRTRLRRLLSRLRSELDR